jgi:Ca2+-binding RTX toxin-like protein
LVDSESPATIEGKLGDQSYVFQNGWATSTIAENPGSGAGNDTLNFDAIAEDLTFTVKRDGSVRVVASGGNSLTAHSIESLVGGRGNNSYQIESGATLDGSLIGGSAAQGKVNKLIYLGTSTATVTYTGVDNATRFNGSASRLGRFENIHQVEGTAGSVTFLGSQINGVDNVLTGGSKNDVITGGNSGNNTLAGAVGNDVLLGGIANDLISGGQGDDTLTGGEGNDQLDGGTGNDTYVFGAEWGADKISEQTSGGTDVLDFSSVAVPLSFSINSDSAGNNPGVRVTDFPAGFGETGPLVFLGDITGPTSADLTSDELVFTLKSGEGAKERRPRLQCLRLLTRQQQHRRLRSKSMSLGLMVGSFLAPTRAVRSRSGATRTIRKAAELPTRYFSTPPLPMRRTPPVRN